MCIRVGLGVADLSRTLAPRLRERERSRLRSRALTSGLRERSRRSRFGGGLRERVLDLSRFLTCALRERERLRSLCLTAGLRERSLRLGGGLRERSRLFGGGLRECEREPLLRDDDDDDEVEDPLELDELERDPDSELLRDELLSEELFGKNFLNIIKQVFLINSKTYLSLESLLDEAEPRRLRSLSLPRFEFDDELTLFVEFLMPSLLSFESFLSIAFSVEGE